MRVIFLRVASIFLLLTAFPILRAYPQRTVPPDEIHVKESTARLVLQGSKSVFSVELSSSLAGNLPATFSARILSPDDRILAEASLPMSLTSAPGRIELALNWAPRAGLFDAASSRLVYEVRAAGAVLPGAHGVLSPLAITQDIFELTFTGLAGAGLGSAYTTRVWATRPNSHLPVAGVELSGLIGDEEDATPGQHSRARTNSQGIAVLKFHLPNAPGAAADNFNVDIEIQGKKGAFENSVTGEITVLRLASVLLSTDKPIYQASQTLHMRAFLLDDQKHAAAKQPVRFKIHDPDDTAVFSAEVESSRFGIASADWPIPESQKFGNYRVSAVILGEAGDRELEARQTVRISRYELPTFMVNVKPDQPFYLPGQNAQLTVSATYMFGKPVLRGHARVVREASRKWNYQSQKWETEEGAVLDGELDASGEFHANLDLSKDHANFHDEDWKRYEDLRFAAYLTDSSSGRTQDRRFDLRLSRDALHLYLIGANGPLSAQLAPVFYVNTSTADGVPAAADVEVKLYSQDPSDTTYQHSDCAPFASAKVHTNKYGVARLRFPSPITKSSSRDRSYISLQAKTLDGRTGKHVELTYLSGDAALRVTPSKAILSSGEPIEVLIESSIPRARIEVDVFNPENYSLISSQEISLTHGTAHATFPFDPRFTGFIEIVARTIDIESETDFSRRPGASARVVYPHPEALQLQVKPVKASYRPGETATVDLRILSPEGEAKQGALGLLVYDHALEELARTEAGLSTDRGDSIDPRLGFHAFDQGGAGIGGISETDLLNLRDASNISAGLELVAEAQLFPDRGAGTTSQDSNGYWNFSDIFGKQIHASLDPVVKLVNGFFNTEGRYPSSDQEFAEILRTNGVNPTTVTDPWASPYHVHREVRSEDDVFSFVSLGPDKEFQANDDFTAMTLSRPFFSKNSPLFREVIQDYYARTGKFICDLPTLTEELARKNIALDSLRDPWGTPYRFEFGVDRGSYTVTVLSAGPDGKFENPADDFTSAGDDLRVAVFPTPYFTETSSRLYQALYQYATKNASFPVSESQFREALRQENIDWEAIRDPWNHAYVVIPTEEASYRDAITVRAYGSGQTTRQTPVTQKARAVRILSNGPDGIPNTPDDFEVARLISPFREETATTASLLSEAVKPKTLEVLSGVSGAIHVLVLDASGAVISNASVTATSIETGVQISGSTDDSGVCLLHNVSPGTYRVAVSRIGFQAYVLTSVPVHSSSVTDLQITLSVGTATQSVEVSAGLVATETSVSSLALLSPSLTLTTKSGAASGRIAAQLATPRLREYFPETLLWQPEVLTDRNGRSSVKILLADSITTWKVSVIASTLDGHIATASRDLRAFQPFFAELDPPKVLTVGDEIHLPVTVRNYLEKPQSLTLDWSAEPWSDTIGPRNATSVVPAGDYAQKTFSFRARLPMKDARQRLSAYNRSSERESDAIETKLRVHADGQERIAQASSVFSGDTSLTLDIPANALPGSIGGELVLYPNLISHVAEGIEAIMERPYGCAEQTISSAYPSFLWLQLKKSQQLPDSPLDHRALHFLNLAYAKLLGYREPGGGFSYWGKGNPRISLTAYALRFLSEASEFISVDPDLVGGTRTWLLKQSTPQGFWRESGFTGNGDDWYTLYETAYVTRILAEDLQHRAASEKDSEAERTAVRKGAEYLTTKPVKEDDPYRLALLTLAKQSLKEDASKEIAALVLLAHPQGEQLYWAAEHDTVFYGWGYAGRIETTALVLNVLAVAKLQNGSSAQFENALSRGTVFLLKNKDPYGVWYSTQATVNVLQCLVRQLEIDNSATPASGAKLQVQIDGQPGPEIRLPSYARQFTPLRADLIAFLSPGEHRIELRGGPLSRSTASVNATYYVPWRDRATSTGATPSGDAEALRYSVSYDRTAAAEGEPLKCTVHAERVGFHGYGMMLAEVGLPPGADVDRASIETAVQDAGLDVQSYEIQPDRVVFYLWPRAGGTTFSFSLKPRFAMNAQSAESILYDYYNPDAHASVPPARFTIH